MNLDLYGGACRCLLRLRENTGQPILSDEMFISQYASRYPEWLERPGIADMFILCDLARDLKLAAKVEVFRDYDRILQEHRAGRSILLITERTPDRAKRALTDYHFVLLLLTMNEDGFSFWCPYPSGLSDALPTAPRACWDEWLTVGVVLYPR